MTDEYSNWRRALAGEKQKIFETVPWVGYFAVQDRSPGATPAKGNRWPLIACAIMLQPDGTLTAERAGKPVDVEWIWPYAASRPISYERYRFWHENHRWPEEAEAA